MLIIFNFHVFANEAKVKLVKSNGSKHVVLTSKNLGYRPNDTFSISNGSSNSIDFKILKVNKDGIKLLLQGPENISFNELCSFGCVGSVASLSLEDEFNGVAPERSPASTPMQANHSSNPILKKAMFGLSFAAINQALCDGQECVDDNVADNQERLINTGLEVFGEYFLTKKTHGNMLGGLSVGAGLMYMSKDLGLEKNDFFKDMENWSMDVIQPSIYFNYTLAPSSLYNFFAGVKLNYSIILTNEDTGTEVFDAENKLTGTSELEYEGGLSVGFQTGINFNLDPVVLQLRYQAYTVNGEVTASQTIKFNGEVDPDNTFTDTNTAYLAVSQVMVSVGMAF